MKAPLEDVGTGREQFKAHHTASDHALLEKLDSCNDTSVPLRDFKSGPALLEEGVRLPLSLSKPPSNRCWRPFRRENCCATSRREFPVA